MTDSSPRLPIADVPPWSNQITDYDRCHVQLYLRLLDAETEGADPSEIIRLLLGIDPSREPERGLCCLESHLKRAHWIAECGYRDLLSSR